MTVLRFFRFVGLAVFFMSSALFLITLLNSWLGFAATDWLKDPFWRVYLFFAVSGILLYILITFRRKNAT
ncbi:hypothetical protein [Planococcus sp. ISL-109]|uniref:hypothetical protein n=1 Tax=Planococcus sp. ISL-109 TaxID=2819166 RepID=UPI001BEC8510|nr:hypothetical protein [Planococcus sp. ISL-109]MBT2582731.1 hypothetical protein [Planococcus sp. ISL-109]